MQKSGKGMLRSAILAALLLTLLSTAAWAETLSTLGPGSKGEAVLQLKNELKEKGYYTVKSDTSQVYTNALKGAVGVFQIANSIKPTKALGYADPQTQKLAASDDAVFYAEYVEKQTDAQLKLGGSGTYVTKAQKQLTKLGFYSGKIDGKYRTPTMNAVKYFQKANSIGDTGIADRATRTVLYATDGTTITRAQYEDAHNLTPLSFGSKGTQVKQLQERLSAKGYYWDEPSGEYNAQTKYSVKFFQEANGLSANGVASSSLRALANTDSAVSFDTYTKNMKLLQLSSQAKQGIRVAVLQLQLRNLGYYKGVIAGAYTSSVISAVKTFQVFNNMKSTYVTGKANTATRTLLNSTGALAYSAVCGDDTLKPGDKGTAVEKLQARLEKLGYYSGSVDGSYSSSVASAVKLFQRYNSFYPTGIAYTNVQTKLYDDSAVSYTNSKIEKLIEVAESKYGCEYTSGKSGPREFDCSGFTAYCLRQVGIYVTAEVQSQGRSKIGLGKKITNYKELKRGDIVFFWSPDHKKKPGHAGIFLGIKGKQYRMIHASSSYDKVTITDINDSSRRDYYLTGDKPAFLWAIRVWE